MSKVNFGKFILRLKGASYCMQELPGLTVRPNRVLPQTYRSENGQCQATISSSKRLVFFKFFFNFLFFLDEKGEGGIGIKLQLDYCIP